MKTLRSGFLGIMAAILSGFFVLGIFSLAVVEGMITLPPTTTALPTLAPPNLTPVLVIQVTATIFPLPTSTFPPAPTQCPPPAGWQPYIVQPGDSLADLAATHGISLKTLMSNNCLISSQLVMNTLIYLPAFSTPTTVPVQRATETAITTVQNTPACGQPPGWISYTVKPGDTLTRISLLYRISVWQLKQVNCLTSDFIRAGQVLFVPNVATSTFTASPSATNTAVPPTKKPTTVQTTVVPTSPSTVTPTATDTPTATSTPPPTAPPSSTPSNTPTATPTDTSTVSPTATPTETQAT